MLLGIVLHAALSFAPIPWAVKDSQQSDFYYVLFAGIHGFRMPLYLGFPTLAKTLRTRKLLTWLVSCPVPAVCSG